MEDIKNTLLQMQDEILVALEREHGITKNEGVGEVGDEGDHASIERTREFYRLLSKRDQKKLNQIRKALLKIDRNEYGVCEECDEKIEMKRLCAVPFTRLCFDCQSNEEINYQDNVEYDDYTDYGTKEDELY